MVKSTNLIPFLPHSSPHLECLEEPCSACRFSTYPARRLFTPLSLRNVNLQLPGHFTGLRLRVQRISGLIKSNIFYHDVVPINPRGFKVPHYIIFDITH